MPWRVVFFDGNVETEMEAQAEDIRVRFLRIVDLIEDHGPQALPPKLVKHLDKKIWELRIMGKDGIVRALYVTASGQRLVILRVFAKKTQKTPAAELQIAQKRAKEVV